MNYVENRPAGFRDPVTECFLESGDQVSRHSMLFKTVGLPYDRPVSYESKAARLGIYSMSNEMATKGVAAPIVTEMLAHPIKRGLRVDGRAVAGSTNIINGPARRRLNLPHIQPETPLQYASVENDLVGHPISKVIHLNNPGGEAAATFL
jgi:hypothetical protein